MPDNVHFLVRSDTGCCRPIGFRNENVLGSRDGEGGAVSGITTSMMLLYKP